MKTGHGHSGFTLLELLAAAAISVLLFGLVLAVTVGALDLWRKGQGDFTVVADATLALDLLERDLQSAAPSAGNRTWFALSIAKEAGELRHRGWLFDGMRQKPGGSVSFRPLPEGLPESDLSEARFGLSGAWLRILTTTAESGTEGALPRAVAWQVARRPVTGPVRPTNPASRRYLLHRSALSAEDTFVLGGDLSAVALSSRSEVPAGTRAPSTIANPAVVDAVIGNVIDFGLWLYARDDAGKLSRVFPATPGDADIRFTSTGSVAPAVTDVFLRVLTDEGARQLELIEAGKLPRPAGAESDEAWWWSVAEAHSRVLVRRVELRAATR